MSVRTSAAVWECSQHSGTELLMLLAIADFADDNGNAYPSVGTLATKCRTTSRHANRILSVLRTSGELEIRMNEGPKGTNRYRITFAGMTSTSPLTNRSPLTRASSTPDVHVPKPLTPTSDESSLNRHESPDTSLSAKKPTRLACPHDEIRSLYAEILPTQPAIKVWTPRRQIATKARWDEMAKARGWTSTADGLAWFRKFFETVAASDFLMGRGERKAGHEGWRCDFDFLMTPAKFVGVIEGKYANREAA